MDRGDRRGYRSRRHRRLTLAAVAVGCIGLMSTTVTGCSDNQPTQRAAAPSVNLASAPTNVQWADFHGMRIPQAKEGPHDFTDAVAPDGFDRSPVGAALDAINATVRLSVAHDGEWPTVVRKLVAPGATRDAFITSRIQLSTTSDVPAAEAPTIQGWKVTSFDPSKATVDIYSQMPDGSHTLNHTTVLWTSAGDWQLLLPESTATTSPVVAVAATPADMVRVRTT